jgi:hypothetical protein
MIATINAVNLGVWMLVLLTLAQFCFFARLRDEYQRSLAHLRREVKNRFGVELPETDAEPEDFPVILKCWEGLVLRAPGALWGAVVRWLVRPAAAVITSVERLARRAAGSYHERHASKVPTSS